MANLEAMLSSASLLASVGAAVYQGRQAHDLHEKEVAMNVDLYRRDVQLAKQQHLMATIADIELNLAQMQADRHNAMKESVRDMFDQRNQQLQTIIVASSLMMTGCITLLITGVLPDGNAEELTIAFALMTGSSFACLFVAIVLCIETLRLASRFMYNRAKADNLQNKKQVANGEKVIKTISSRKFDPGSEPETSGKTRHELKSLGLANDTYFAPSRLPPYAHEVMETHNKEGKKSASKKLKFDDEDIPMDDHRKHTVDEYKELKDHNESVTEVVWRDIELRSKHVTETFLNGIGGEQQIREKEISGCRRFGRLLIGFVNKWFFWPCFKPNKRRMHFEYFNDKEERSASRHRTLVSFEKFWRRECGGYAKAATNTFYMGTFFLLIAVCIWCWSEFYLKYLSFTAAVVGVVAISMGFLVGFGLYAVVSEAGQEGMWRRVREKEGTREWEELPDSDSEDEAYNAKSGGSPRPFPRMDSAMTDDGGAGGSLGLSASRKDSAMNGGGGGGAGGSSMKAVKARRLSAAEPAPAPASVATPYATEVGYASDTDSAEDVGHAAAAPASPSWRRMSVTIPGFASSSKKSGHHPSITL